MWLTVVMYVVGRHYVRPAHIAYPPRRHVSHNHPDAPHRQMRLRVPPLPITTHPTPPHHRDVPGHPSFRVWRQIRGKRLQSYGGWYSVTHSPQRQPGFRAGLTNVPARTRPPSLAAILNLSNTYQRAWRQSSAAASTSSVPTPPGANSITPISIKICGDSKPLNSATCPSLSKRNI